VNRWQGHVIVCGLHGLGVRVVEQLQAADVTVVVVDDDPDPRLARLAHGWGVPHLADNPRIAQTLEDAGADRAAALLCMESDDLHTLEVALLARERYPDLRIVARLSNPAVGSALADIVGERSVPDVAEVTAPAVVEAAPWPCAPAGTCRSARATRSRCWVGRSDVTDGGGYLFRAVGAALRTAFDRQVQIVVTVLLALVVVSTAVLTHHRDGQGGMGVVDAVYFTVETIGTVGYGDFSFREQPTWLRIYAIGLMLVGAAMATLIYALLTNALVSRRLEEQLPQLRRWGCPSSSATPPCAPRWSRPTSPGPGRWPC
jgi:multidrug transporter EmrE-like cation transporter